MKRLNWMLALLVLTAAVLPLKGHDDQKDLRALMQRKLQAAQKVLEGIALNDPDRITKSAEDLILISKEAEWKVIKTPQYELFSNDFRRAATTLIEKAKDRNVDGATLAYVDLTMSCVRCHKYCREVGTGRLDDTDRDWGSGAR